MAPGGSYRSGPLLFNIRLRYNIDVSKNKYFIVIGLLVLASFIIFNIYQKKSPKSQATSTSTKVDIQSDWSAGTLDNIVANPGGNIEISNLAGSSKLDLAAYYSAHPERVTSGQNSGDIGNIFDGNESTQWGITLATQQDISYWVKIDLGSVRHITRTRGKPNSVWYAVNGSTDDVSYTPLFLFHGSPAHQWYDDTVSVDYRYIQITVPGPDMPQMYPANVGLYEFELYTSGATGIHTTGATQIDGGVNFWNWDSFNAIETAPQNTSTAYRYRTSPDGASWTGWTSNFSSVTSRSGDTRYRYLQVEATLSSGDGTHTPTIDEYDIGYHTEIKPNAPTAQTAVVQ